MNKAKINKEIVLTEGKEYFIHCKNEGIEYNEKMLLKFKNLTMLDSPNDVVFAFELKNGKLLEIYPDDIYKIEKCYKK